MSQTPNVDQDLERAMAAEAVYAYDRYLAYGVAPEDYASSALAGIVTAAAEAWEVDGLVTVETVCKALQRVGKLSGIGGPTGLADMLASTAVPDLDRFVELKRLRRVRESAMDVVRRAESGDLHQALAALGEAQTLAIDSGRVQAEDAYDVGLALLKAIQERRVQSEVVHPGLECMHRAMGEIPLGGMTVIGGGTNVGKSSLALEMLIRAAQRNVTVGYVSCEDPRLVVGSRLLSAFTGLSSRELSTGRIDQDKWSRLAAGYEPLRNMRGKMFMAFCIGGNEIDVMAAMSRCAMRGAKIVVVDYVQTIDSSKRQQDRRNEIRWLCARLKAHAQRLNVHLVLLSQLSRPPKDDPFREPTKHDLKEAGDIENAAEYVLVLWRECDDDFAPVRIKLAKSKMGNVGCEWQMHRDAGARFVEVDGSFVSSRDKRAGVSR